MVLGVARSNHQTGDWLAGVGARSGRGLTVAVRHSDQLEPTFNSVTGPASSSDRTAVLPGASPVSLVLDSGE